MSIEKNAQEILDLATYAQHTREKRVKTRSLAKEILAAFEWVDCDERLPDNPRLVRVIGCEGSDIDEWRDSYSEANGWEYSCSPSIPVKWRELL